MLDETSNLICVNGSIHFIFRIAGREGGGGDVSCEDRFKIIRDDIKKWISDGGSAALTLPPDVTSQQYDAAMLENIGRAQVSCTDEPVKIGKAEKTCKFFWDDSNAPNILCNRTLFVKETKGDDQYVQVHHEYAGLANLEAPDGEGSKYPISNQITEFFENKVSRHLAVKGKGKLVSTAVCASAIEIVKKDNTGNGYMVRGPYLSMDGENSKVVAWPNEKHAKLNYNVTALKNGQLEVWINITQRNGREDQLLSQNAFGFVSDDIFTETYYSNASAMGRGVMGGRRCQIVFLQVRCASTKELADKLWTLYGTDTPFQPDLELEQMPLNCRP